MSQIHRPPPRLIVTADDFGLAVEINDGIVEAFRRGIVTSTSLLMNGAATAHAVALARSHPKLEVGLHLSIVEGISLRGKPGTTTDRRRYFGDALCLHRHWRPFLWRYITRRIDLGELEEELELQIERFVAHFGRVPFANATQHLHLLPGVQDLVVRLAQKHRIGALRIPARSLAASRARRLYRLLLTGLARRAQHKLVGSNIRTVEHFGGFDVCGRMTEAQLRDLLTRLPAGTTEIMTHPGHDCPQLRDALPWAYRDFAWAQELQALTSAAIRTQLTRAGIELIRFGDLQDARVAAPLAPPAVAQPCKEST